MSINRPISYIAQTHPRQERKRFQLKGKTIGLLAVLFILASLIGWFYLTQASEATTTALRLQRLASEREHLRRESAEIRYRIAELENLSRIRERARLLGLGPPQKVEYLYIERESEISSAPIKEDDLLSPTGDDLWRRVLSFLQVLLFGEAKSEGTTEASDLAIGNENKVEIKR
ncbi:MAG TPA: hypothetical protein DCP08_04360 [Chloroflexi bacterium]|nr:hypothetical protein [Chloroflexota bacterium]